MKILKSKRDALTKIKRSLLSKPFFSATVIKILWFFYPTVLQDLSLRYSGQLVEFSHLLSHYFMDTSLDVAVSLDAPQEYVWLPLGSCAHLGT